MQATPIIIAIFDSESLKVVGPAGALAVMILVLFGWALKWLITHFKEERDQMHISHREERKEYGDAHREERAEYKDFLEGMERRSEVSQSENRKALEELTKSIRNNNG